MASKNSESYAGTPHEDILELHEDLDESEVVSAEEGIEETDESPERERKSNINVLSAYLNEIKKWPILSKEGEQVLAQRLSKAEQHKRSFTESWVLIYAGMLDWNKIRAIEQQLSASRHNRLYAVIQSIRIIRSLNTQVKGIEHAVSDGRHTYYKIKKLCREKASHLIRKNELLIQLDLFKAYKSGIVGALKPYLKTALPKRTQRNVFRILRELLKYHKQANTAKSELVRSNLRLVVGIAKKYVHANRGLLLSDLIQEGNIGLMKAIDKFDYRLGNRLSTYASWWIRQSIIRSIEDKSSTIRVPVYINGRIKKLLKNMQDIDIPVALEHGSESDEEFRNLFSALQVMKDPISLETPFADDGSNLHECIPDMMPPSPLDQVLQYQLLEEAEEVLKGLHPRDERVLRLRFGLGVESEHTLEEIGEEFGISRERIRQIETTALRKIKDSIGSQGLRLYLDR